MRATLLGALAVLTASVPGVGRGDDWPQFRGPNGSATSTEKKLPVQWGSDKNIAWKTKLPGYGWSSPIVWGDKVFLTTAVSEKQRKPAAGFGGGGRPGQGGGRPGQGGRGGFGGRRQAPDAIYKLEVYCLDRASGKVLWKQPAYEGKPHIPTQASNTYATETPVTDGERVYAYFGMHGVYCYDLSGKQLWKADLGSYSMAMGHGTGSSPALADGRLFIQCDNEEKSFLAALDAKTGKELWRVKRSERTGYSTPLIWKNKARTEVVCLGSPRVRSYDPATGKQLWELGGMAGQAKATPVASGELLFVGTGGGPGGFGGRGGRGGRGGGLGGGGSRPLFAVKAGASGDITLKAGATSNDGIAWYQPKAGPQTASPVLYQGYLYVLDERGGYLSCYDAKTGKQEYKERLTGARGFTSSPWAADGKVFFLDDAGTTHIVQAGPTFKILGKSLLGEMCWSSPAVAGQALFLRTVDHLFCIKQKDGE